jgi:hypothetical protein
MIDNALKVIANELNKYVVRKLDPDRDPSTTKRIAIGNIAKVQDNDASGPRPDSASAPGLITWSTWRKKKCEVREQLHKSQ